ncbi:hypothetical protein N7517_010985 [Penicillium concentricum]|uniref:Uncharacterized protein n=1 Tax=Penicillium concentricum TaxID=293559 RepID=A0A9W9RA32_9EURO|nr:uncharacterized protein N7517_010985 [Penicillium concentricum]KAJ5356376.1 hypothetical protein N7517_010985 [Penicillium concentricum]
MSTPPPPNDIRYPLPASPHPQGKSQEKAFNNERFTPAEYHVRVPTWSSGHHATDPHRAELSAPLVTVFKRKTMVE